MQGEFLHQQLFAINKCCASLQALHYLFYARAL